MNMDIHYNPRTPLNPVETGKESQSSQIMTEKQIWAFTEQKQEELSSLPTELKDAIKTKEFADLTNAEKEAIAKHFGITVENLTESLITAFKSHYMLDVDGNGKVDEHEKKEIEKLAQQDFNKLNAEQQAQVTAFNNINQKTFEKINAVSGQVVHPTGKTQN